MLEYDNAIFKLSTKRFRGKKLATILLQIIESVTKTKA